MVPLIGGFIGGFIGPVSPNPWTTSNMFRSVTSVQESPREK